MDKKELNDLLDCIYELEGLVHLAISRDDNPVSLPELIARKGEELAARAQTIGMSNPITDCDSQPVFEDYQEDKPASGIFNEDFIDDPYAPDETAAIAEVKENTDAPVADNTLKTRGKLVFSINDRYRFKRELFNNSDAEFNNTLALVASMDNYDEAEDYFINELQFDPSVQEVADFLDIIKKYFAV